MDGRKIWCLIYKPDGSVFEFYVRKKCTGLDCLLDVCKMLRVVEIQYFGLKSGDAASNLRWINLRNRLKDEVPMMAPVRLFLQVKFFVNPQAIHQSVTSDLFYDAMMIKLNSGEIDVTAENPELVARLAALHAIVETRSYDFKRNVSHSLLLPMIRKVTKGYGWVDNVMRLCVKMYEELFLQLNAQEAKILFLRTASGLDLYGSERYEISYFSSQGREKRTTANGHFKLYVCTSKLRVQPYHTPVLQELPVKPLHEIPFHEISTVSFKGYTFTVSHSKEETRNLPETTVFRLASVSESISLFRTFTEFHTFFYCRSVKTVVASKEWPNTYGRLNSGPFWKFGSICKNKSQASARRRFLFDVQCTRRQAHEYSYQVLSNPFKQNEEEDQTNSTKTKSNPKNHFRISFMPECLVPTEYTRRMVPSIAPMQLHHAELEHFPASDPNAQLISRLKLIMEKKELEELRLGQTPPESYQLPATSEIESRPPTAEPVNIPSPNLYGITPADLTLREEEAAKLKITDVETAAPPPLEETPKASSSLPPSDDKLCALCLGSAINCVFCPCGHAVSCLPCSEQCRKCPICRSGIHVVQRIYFV